MPVPFIYVLRVFTKLDLTQAYQQVELDEESKLLVTIATHKGLFKSNRLSYGVASAPGLFQREMDIIFQDLDKVAIFFDDLVVTGATREEHDRNLTCVLKRLQDCGLTLSKDKCAFAQSNIKFLGFELNAQGIQASSKKVDAIVNMKKPDNLTELKSFLGMINYYSKFIKDYSDLLSPLYKLLRKDKKWCWAKEQELAFKKAKERLASREILIHYSSDYPLKITCDASPVGLGAVVSHILPDGSDRPIAYASRVLSVAQRNYSQLDREALALVFGVKAFHQYVYGRNFILETDHKPLTYIFGPKKGIPQMAANRVQRWAVILASYDFIIKYIKGQDNGPADGLSRVSMKDTSQATDSKDLQVHNYLKAISEELQNLDSKAVRKGTSKDALLSKVRNFVMQGWPDKVEKCFEPFKSRRLELSVEDGCIMWGYRVVIPPSLRAELLVELHGIHLGVVKMKALARSYFWWPGLDKNIEEITKSCKGCLESADDPPKSTLHVWKWPQGPNHRIHLDFYGPIGGHIYLVITDAYSK
ncbi:PREDICTED: uncharacterized protein K02A2.6-like [Cyphomyrmex costatus]|uniref:uncharacterized protein K02A2.6-like n=1 Tax=Cyphomyrmex costatus TaxID=456900 RepID=UPI000852205A|nr:PREDICTED: uncharacterized protein K02A2.6-like [Cyphomyrmex costatus]